MIDHLSRKPFRKVLVFSLSLRLPDQDLHREVILTHTEKLKVSKLFASHVEIRTEHLNMHMEQI